MGVCLCSFLPPEVIAALLYSFPLPAECAVPQTENPEANNTKRKMAVIKKNEKTSGMAHGCGVWVGLFFNNFF